VSDCNHSADDFIGEQRNALTQSGGMLTIADKLAWPALLRKLDRIDPSFRN
jgi:hypothetical protein